VFKDIKMNNTTLTESMSSLKQRLQLIETETTNEAGTVGAGERAAEKFGLNAAKQALRNTANKARERLANKIAPAGEKKVVTPAAPAAAEKGGYVPATRDAEAVNGLNAEQKQLSDYFANPKNHVTKDGKVYGRDPNKVGEFVELDAKTLLPKGQLGVNRPIFHANGPLSQELQALEKLGPKEIEALKTKALNSALTDAEKAEVKSGGIINWIKKNPKKAYGLGLLAAVAAGTAYMMSGDGKEEPTTPDTTTTVADKPTPQQITPQQAEEQILAIIAELEKEPACAEDVAKIKAELARIKSGQVATPAPVPPSTIAAKPTDTTSTTTTPPTGAQPYEVKQGDNLTKIAQQMGTTLPELLKANPQYAANPNLILPGQKVNPPATTPVAKPEAPAQKLSGTPTIPANVAESDELARWLKIARG
jgi:LysM repeat protein